MRLNERRNQECCRKKPMDCEERRLPMRVEILGRRLRGWFTLPRAWLSADKPKSRYPSELLRTFKLTSTKWKSPRILYFLSLFPRLLSSFTAKSWDIRVWIALVLSEIRVFREFAAMFSLGLRTIAIKQREASNGRALLLYVHPCVRYVSTLPLGIFAYFIISVGRWKVMLVFVQRESRWSWSSVFFFVWFENFMSWFDGVVIEVNV